MDLELDEFGLRRLKGEPPSFEYLTTMPMRSLTKERVEELQKRYADKQVELATLMEKTPSMMWKEELLKLKEYLIKREENRKKTEAKELLVPNKAKASSRKKKK